MEQNHRPFKTENAYFDLVLHDKKKSGYIYDKSNGQRYDIEIFFTDKEYDRMRVSTAMDFAYIKEKFTLANGQPINVLTDIPGKDLIEKSTGKSYKVEYVWTFYDRVYIISIFALPEAFDRFIFKDNLPFGALQD